VQGYHPRCGGRYDSQEDQSPTPEPPATRVFSWEIRTANIPQHFLQPTTIVKYLGETDPRVWLNDYRMACQLGGTTNNSVIIRNLPLHLAESTRTWLEHLPASQIHSWDNLVLTFGELPGHIRAPRELLGSVRVHPKTRRVPPRLHPTLLEVLHRASEHRPVQVCACLPRGHDLSGPGA
jgi:hypothetical protein